jgi:hypothetical protein
MQVGNTKTMSGGELDISFGSAVRMTVGGEASCRRLIGMLPQREHYEHHKVQRSMGWHDAVEQDVRGLSRSLGK